MGDLDFSALRRAEVGSRLRVARERLGLSLDDIQQATRVPMQHLEAIERGDASSLPSPAYVTGFVRAYARELGLDSASLVRVYRGEAEAAPLPPPEAVPVAAAPPSPSVVAEAAAPEREELLSTPLLIGGAGIVVLLLSVAVVLLWRPLATSGASVELPPLQAAAPRAAERVALPATDGEAVVVTAKERVTLRIFEPRGRVLFDGELAADGSYRVPRDARDPRISTRDARRVAVTLGGVPVGFTSRPSVSAARISPAALRLPPPDGQDAGARQAPRTRGEVEAVPSAAARPEALPPLAVTTKAGAPTVSTPLENAQ